jgi:hypothetical protein
MMAVQKPALKIPPITSHELNVTINASAKTQIELNCFIAHLFFLLCKSFAGCSSIGKNEKKDL